MTTKIDLATCRMATDLKSKLQAEMSLQTGI
jgi:hypothetical protein